MSIRKHPINDADSRKGYEVARHYSGVMRGLQGRPRVPAEQAIRSAREEASGQLRLVEEL